ncbi:SulP family inorganic anion transporter [Klebsiella pneumoniae]|nr:SulP family inorganic anion transporter [Klebsiella pneumoniae]
MNTLRQDSLAGIVVFLVALPLCLGIAQASGLPPFVGLLTGIIGGLVVTALSPSRFAVSGPAAGLVTIVVAAIESLGSFSLFLMALVLAGVLQLLFGILRAGRFISLVPASVIKGMLAAIGILLIMQQIPVALGTAEETGLAEVVQGNAAFSVTAIAVAAGGLLVLWLWGSPLIRRVKSLRWIPGPLIAVLLGCVTTLLLTHFAPQQLAALPRITLPAFGSLGDLLGELESPAWSAWRNPSVWVVAVTLALVASLGDLLGELESPAWSAWRNPSVWVVAVTLALVASLETLLSQEALKKLRPQNPPPSPNREMVAQGVGNLLSGVLGAMPITAVIVRSSVNVSNGAQSKLSIFIHGVLLLICGLWFSGLLTLIPLASLAAVLLYTGYKLATPRLFIEQFRQGAAQYVPFLATIGGIIAFGMLAGIGIGLATQMAFSLWRSHRHSLQLARYDDHYVLRIQQNLTFMHNPHLLALLAKIPEKSVVIVEHDSVGYLDPDVRAVLDDFAENAPQRGIRLNQWPLASR